MIWLQLLVEVMVIMLVLLDLSAALDTINHDNLLHVLLSCDQLITVVWVLEKLYILNILFIIFISFWFCRLYYAEYIFIVYICKPYF